MVNGSSTSRCSGRQKAWISVPMDETGRHGLVDVQRVPGLLLGLGQVARRAHDERVDGGVGVGVALEQLLDDLRVVLAPGGAGGRHPPGEAEVVGRGLVELGEVLGGDGVARQRVEGTLWRSVRALREDGGPVGDPAALLGDAGRRACR